MALTLGYKASAEQFGPRELLDLTLAAERTGLDSVWISDHLQPWRHDGGHSPAAMAWLGAAAAQTDRVVLGTSVLTPTFRHHPAVVAQTFGTLGCLAPGRIVLGVGTGEALNEVAIGAVDPWPDFTERFARLRESVRLIRALWRGEHVDFEGDYYRLDDVTLYDTPDPEIPVYVAAGGPTMAKYAGRMGDGLICTSGKGRELYTEKLLPAVAEGRAAGRRGDTPFDRMIEVKLSYDRDRERALENTRFWAPLSLTPEQKHSFTSPQEMERAADQLPIEQVARRWIVASDPDAAVEAVRDYVEMGFTHLVFHAPGQDQRRFLDAFGADLLPRLRELT